MKINLDGVIKLVDSLMADTCTITRPDRLAGATWDPTTGTYSDDPAPGAIYDGPCNIYNRRFQGGIGAEGGGAVQATEYWMEIPVDQDIRINPRDVVVVTSVHSGGDQTLLNTTFFIIEDITGTYTVSKRMRMTRRTQVPE